MPGSQVSVHGSIDGDIQNESGLLKVYGRVRGTITTHAGTTLIDPGAQVEQVIPPAK